MVTGIDLIKTQIRAAAGEPLGIAQKYIRNVGHAIECRINAEDPDQKFRPCAGLIEKWRVPGGLGVRVDTHGYEGYRLSPKYDSLLAKLIVYQPTRPEAIRCMQRALGEFIIEPLKTTLPFLRKVFANPDFIESTIDTGFVERTF
jgi:acetyl-CoA carboxylase biotin carboxylase subunit